MLRRWWPGRPLVAAAEGSDAALALPVAGRSWRTPVAVVARPPLGAAPFEPAPPAPPHRAPAAQGVAAADPRCGRPWHPRGSQVPGLDDRAWGRRGADAQQNSDYIDVLANDDAAPRARALVHRHVYTSTEPAPSANRELAATAASRVTGCAFCASVHARMYAGFAKNRELAVRVLADGVAADLPPLERAIVDLAARLTTDPEALTAADLAPLRAQGLDDLAILDAINDAAFFANANRLMLSLGEPRAPASR